MPHQCKTLIIGDIRGGGGVCGNFLHFLLIFFCKPKNTAYKCFKNYFHFHFEVDTGTTPKSPPAVTGCQRIEKNRISHENLPIWFLTLYLSSWPSFCLLGIHFHSVPLVTLMPMSQNPVHCMMLGGLVRDPEHRWLTHPLGGSSS